MQKINPTLLLFICCNTIFISAFSITEKAYNEFFLTQNGIERHYLVHFPPAKALQHKLPLLFCLHGSGGTAKGMIRLTNGRFNDLADSEGFIVVYPDAIRKNWNDGRGGYYSYAVAKNIDDVGFIRMILEQLEKDYKIDQNNIFTSGMSNGGFMSMRLACELSGVFHGAAIIAATLGADFLRLCQPEKPVKLLIMNGTTDPLVPYNGGEIGLFRKTRGKVISTDKLVKFWAEHNACNPDPIKYLLPDAVPSDSTRVEKYVFTNGKEGCNVILYRIIGGGHTWPGGLQYLREGIIGRTCRDINACDEIWNFFKN